MLFKLSVLALAAFAVATPAKRGGGGGGGGSNCNTGPIQCCDSVEPVSDPVVATLLGLLGINVGDVTGLVGITCSPITLIGAGSSSW